MFVQKFKGKTRGYFAICICDYCGKEFKRAFGNVFKSSRHYCNRDHKCKWISENLNGENSSLYGIKKSKEHIERIKNTLTGRKHSDEWKKKIGESNKGHICSEETRRKISISNLKDGRILNKAGYALVHKPEHPNVIYGNYVYEHRIIMEEMLGRYLELEERVHHINGIKNDNRKENLMLFKNTGEHTKYHSLIK